MKIAIMAVLIMSVISGVLFWQFGLSLIEKTQAPQQITLNYWGLFEDERTVIPIIESYQKSHPDVKINYVKQSPLNYRTRLQTQLRSGSGPDIFRIHNSWLAMFKGDLAAAPESVMTALEFKKTFYPTAEASLTSNGKVYAIPLEIDGLSLYVNTDILKAANVAMPKTWQEFIDAASKVTVKNQQGQIQTAGAALGTANNVDFWPEILGLLFLQQPKVLLSNPATSEGAEVLNFYTSFVTNPQTKVWDTNLPSSSQMFAEGKLAFYFGTSRKAISFAALSPNLHFTTIPVPQLEANFGWGSYWAEAVSAKSRHPKQAWEFLKALALPKALQFSSAENIKISGYGRPYSRVDMSQLQSSDPVLGAFVNQGPYYNSWYLNSGTRDSGINDEMVSYFEQAVNKVLMGESPLRALEGISNDIKKVLLKYQLTSF